MHRTRRTYTTFATGVQTQITTAQAAASAAADAKIAEVTSGMTLWLLDEYDPPRYCPVGDAPASSSAGGSASASLTLGYVLVHLLLCVQIYHA